MSKYGHIGRKSMIQELKKFGLTVSILVGIILINKELNITRSVIFKENNNEKWV